MDTPGQPRRRSELGWAVATVVTILSMQCGRMGSDRPPCPSYALVARDGPRNSGYEHASPQLVRSQGKDSFLPACDPAKPCPPVTRQCPVFQPRFIVGQGPGAVCS